MAMYGTSSIIGGAYGNTYGAPVATQSYGYSQAPVTYSQPTTTYAASYGNTYGAPIATQSYGYSQAPVTYSAPISTYAAPTIIERDVVYEQPRVIEFVEEEPKIHYSTCPRPPTTPNDRNNLLSAGEIVSERVISVDELAAEGRFNEAEAVEKTYVAAAREMVEVVEIVEPVTYSAPVTYAQAPVTYAAPQQTYAAPRAQIYSTPQTYSAQQPMRSFGAQAYSGATAYSGAQAYSGATSYGTTSFGATRIL